MTYSIKPLTWTSGTHDNFPRCANGIGGDYVFQYDIDGTGEIEVSFDGQIVYRGSDEKAGREASQAHHENQIRKYLTKLNVSERTENAED